MKMHNFFRIFQKLFLKLAGITKGDLTTVSVAHAVRVGKYERVRSKYTDRTVRVKLRRVACRVSSFRLCLLLVIHIMYCSVYTT